MPNVKKVAERIISNSVLRQEVREFLWVLMDDEPDITPSEMAEEVVREFNNVDPAFEDRNSWLWKMVNTIDYRDVEMGY